MQQSFYNFFMSSSAQTSGTGKPTISEPGIAVDNSWAPPKISVAHPINVADSAAQTLTREQVRVRIEEIGVIPVIRVASAEDALFAAETIAGADIPVVEISMTVPGAMGVISHLVKHAPEVIIGAGGIFNAKTARQCLDQGAKFLTSDGLVLEVVDFAAKESVVVIPGALTPTEIIAAWNAGSDFVKVYPCDAVGGHNYIRSLKVSLPQARLIAAGGVNRLTALEFIAAGAVALGVGKELFPDEAIWLRQDRRIQELARRFMSLVDKGRASNRPQS
jgi:2-dehydro-3-deoxyphosphogluconate aldolase/(4S)-4-hydroxy-2-oxoglutarate aldolase